MPPSPRLWRPWPRRSAVSDLGSGHVRQHDPVLRAEHLGGRGLDLGLACGQVAAELAVDHLRIVEQRRVHRQPIGPLVDPLQGLQLVRLDQRSCPCQLVVRDRFAAKSLQLLLEGSLHACPDRRPDARSPDRPRSTPRRSGPARRRPRPGRSSRRGRGAGTAGCPCRRRGSARRPPGRRDGGLRGAAPGSRRSGAAAARGPGPPRATRPRATAAGSDRRAAGSPGLAGMAPK